MIMNAFLPVWQVSKVGLPEEEILYCKSLGKGDIWEYYKMLADESRPSFLLDSSMYDPELGRYSIMGWNPCGILRSRGEQIEYYADGCLHKWQGDPLQALEKVRREGQAKLGEELPFPFCGGLVGYISYDMKNNIEKLPQNALDDLHMYDQYWGVYDQFICMDHLRDQLWMVSLDARGLAEMEAEVKEKRKTIRTEGLRPVWMGQLHSNFQAQDYIKSIEKVLQHICRGDIYQLNLSQRFCFSIQGSHKSFYEVLRQINPACFGAYLHFDGLDIMSVSPERYLRVQGRQIETRPIKGTRPRGETAARDEAFKKQLRESEKEQAELLMIVDLERNDLGRICQTGSIRVEELYKISAYPTVFHMDAKVQGLLKPEMQIPDIIRASFPGGSITGAPKIMAMNLIDQLEPHARGLYTGAIGYIDYRADCDLNIAIRTVIIKNEDAYYQAGGGLVADSDPLMEYEETWTKTSALLLVQAELERIAQEKGWQKDGS